MRLKLGHHDAAPDGLPVFQYQKGAIKTCRSFSDPNELLSDFNTKKVRLKLLRLQLGGFLDPEFQYQKGAIKTALVFYHAVRAELFQYQKGAIKT